jgi:hypothetical protein
MTGTAVGLTGQADRSTTTIMFTYPIRRFHQHAATILRTGLRTGRGGSAGPGESVDQGELAGQAVSGVQGESAGLGELAGVLDLALSAERVPPTGWQDHLLGHTIRLKPSRTRASIRT